jgi:hypothetical protein
MKGDTSRAMVASRPKVSFCPDVSASPIYYGRFFVFLDWYSNPRIYWSNEEDCSCLKRAQSPWQAYQVPARIIIRLFAREKSRCAMYICWERGQRHQSGKYAAWCIRGNICNRYCSITRGKGWLE